MLYIIYILPLYWPTEREEMDNPVLQGHLMRKLLYFSLGFNVVNMDHAWHATNPLAAGESCLRTTTSHTTWVAQREVEGLESQLWMAKRCSYQCSTEVGPIGLYGVCDGHGPFGHLVSFRLVTWPRLILPESAKDQWDSWRMTSYEQVNIDRLKFS